MASQPPVHDETNPSLQYVPLEEVEDLDNYRPGGYHPIRIGDCLHDRYTIVHKLGSGGYSTIWLAKDMKSHRYVAVKIATATGDLAIAGKFNESEVLQQLYDAQVDSLADAGRVSIPPILDQFSLQGPNGTHDCLITIPAMMSLEAAKDASVCRLFQLPVARAMIAQLIHGVAFLHSHGIVHADLHLGNILLKLPERIDRLSPDQLYELYGQPIQEPVVRLDNQPLPKGVPTHAISPVWLGKRSEDISLSEAKIFITDFGESFMASVHPRYYSNTPELLLPPEVYFEPDTALSYPVDIWALGVIMWSLLGQKEIFEAYLPSANFMIKEHVETFGELPLKWWSKWDARHKWFNDEGVRVDGNPARPLEERFRAYIYEGRHEECNLGQIGVDEKAAFLSLLRSMMRFTPSARLTIEQVLDSEWVRKWAIPDLKRVKNR